MKNNKKENPFIEIDIEFEEGEILLPISERSVHNIKPYYYVSNKGNIYSDSSGTLKKMSPVSQKVGANKGGAYQAVKLETYKDNEDDPSYRTVKVHRMVASEFMHHLKTDENNTVDHLDSNKENNNVENLEWVSLEENIKRAIENGLLERPLEKDKILLNAISHELKRGILSLQEIADRYNVSRSQVARLKTGSYKDILGENTYSVKRILTDDDLVEIFDRSHAGESFINLANEFGVSVHSIRHIYYPNGGRYEQRLANRGRILAKINKYTSDDELKEIYLKIKEGLSDEEISEEYGYSINTIHSIRNGRGKYGERLQNMGINVEKFEPMSDKILLEIYNLAKEGVKDKDIAKKYNLHPKTVNELRIGGKKYGDFLRKYNLPEIRYQEAINPKSNKFSEEEAISIYNDFKQNKLTTRQMGKKMGCDKSLVANIKYCRGSYDYLKYKYNLAPLE